MFEIQIIEHNLINLGDNCSTVTYGQQGLTYMSHNGPIKIVDHWEVKSRDLIASDEGSVTIKFVLYDKKYLLAKIEKNFYQQYMLQNSSVKSDVKSLFDIKKIKQTVITHYSWKHIFWLCFLVVILIGSFNASSSKSLTVDDKTKICKNYIGTLFNKPVSSINSKGYTNGLVVVDYIRSSDSSTWSYMCDISGDKMVWAGWFSDTGEWGRWRFEDEVVLNFDKETNIMSFVIPSTGTSVRVRL
ncbi:hypothetical protein [uncultured Shewanella sp.]|jgi:hypothetical protein|uniref:hypothetical protein n=1 Tax=uncultured Shewanella sp. TaxID=173975 RepID=UPI003704CBD7